MKKPILNVKDAQKLSKKEQKSIVAGLEWVPSCGGDGSFIFVDGKKVCCFIPWSGSYIC